MSVICQNFVQNAWKKDLCSNCFKSVGDHESIDVVQDSSKSQNTGESRNGKFSSHTSTLQNVRHETTPHTTWKSLITEKNDKNSQPFKLENGFQGRLLTINKALNGTDKQTYGEINVKDRANSPSIPNGTSVKTANGDLKKQVTVKCGNVQYAKKNVTNMKNGTTASTEQNGDRSNSPALKNTQSTSPDKQKNLEKCSQENKISVIERSPNKKQTQSKFTKSNSEETTPPPPAANIHSILKKTASAVSDSSSQVRRSNVGFKDEEPLIIGYGGRDFSPEELDWDMASSDGEAENASDSLDETEDDRVFSKITKENTEFNSDNANLLENKNESKYIKSKKEAKPKETPILTSTNEAQKTKNDKNEISIKTGRYSETKNCTNNQSNVNGDKTEIHTETAKFSETNATIPISEQNNEKEGLSDVKHSSDSVNVAVKSDKTSRTPNTSEVAVFKTTAAVDERVEVKNSSQFINGATPPPCSVDSRNTTESAKTVDAVMFSDGGEQTWQENSAVDGNNEWQDTDAPGQILQAINTSLTNRHKMRENSDLCSHTDEEKGDMLQENDFTNETNKILVSVNNEISNDYDDTKDNFETDKEKETDSTMDTELMNVEPRESFLHGIASKPSAIYGPASDLFVSRSNSSSSSSSDEQGKSQISLSINVIVNGDGSQTYNNFNAEDEGNEDEVPRASTVDTPREKPIKTATENKIKPEVPAKPSKQLAPVKQQHETNYTSKTKIKDETSNSAFNRKCENINEVTYYSSIPDNSRTAINLVDHYAESNIYQEVNDKDTPEIQESEPPPKISGRESKLAALAIELEQVRHTNNIKRQAPAPPKVPDPPLEDPPNCTGRISPIADLPPSFSSFRGESMGFSSASSTTSTSSQDTEAGYASWNLHGDPDDPPKYSKSKSSFLLTQYSKCKMLAMGYAEDGTKARKKFSIKKLLKIGKDTEAPITPPDPNNPNPKAWKYSDHFERPRAKLEIIHPMDLENKSVTVNPGFDSLHSGSMSSFSGNADDTSFRNSISSDYGSFYSDTLSPSQDVKQEVNYEYIQPREPATDENEESSSKTGTSSSTSPTPSRSSTASQASTVTSGSSKNRTVVSHRPPKPPPPPRAHSLLPGNKAVRNLDGTFKFPVVNGDASSSDEVTVTPAKPQAPRRQCKSAIMRSEFTSIDEQKSVHISEQDAICSSEDIPENSRQNGKHEAANGENTSSLQITLVESQTNCNQKDDFHHSDDKSTLKDEESTVFPEEIILINSSVEEGTYDNIVAEKETKMQTSITIKASSSVQKEKLSKSMLSRNKHPPLTKSPARPPPIYSKPQTGSFPKNVQPWKTMEDSYVALTSSNRELLVKLVNQSLKKRKNFYSKLSKIQFQWTDFDIDASQPSSIFAFGEKIVCHATMPEYPEYTLTLVVSIQQQHDRLQENSEIKYPVFGRFADCIPSELLDSSGDNELESMPATILVLDRSNIATIECFSEYLPETLTEENEKEMCFVILQLIQSLKSLQVQGIESIDTNFQTLLLAKAKQDKYHTLVFLYDICYEENDYSSDSCKISLCQYTLMLLLQMLRVQSVDAILSSKFSSSMSRKVFETAFSLLSEEKAVSLSQTKTLFECYLWGVTKVIESLQNADDCDGILHRWLDIERSNCIKSIVNEESNDTNIHNEYYSQFLIRTNVRNIREIASYL